MGFFRFNRRIHGTNAIFTYHFAGKQNISHPCRFCIYRTSPFVPCIPWVACECWIYWNPEFLRLPGKPANQPGRQSGCIGWYHSFSCVTWLWRQVSHKSSGQQKGALRVSHGIRVFFDSCQLGPAQMGCNGKIIITILLSGTFINLQWIHCCSGNGQDPNLSTCKNWEWLEVGRLWHSYGDVHTGEFLNVQVTLVLQVSW